MPEERNIEPNEVLRWTSRIVAAHLRNTQMPLPEIAPLMRSVHRTLNELTRSSGAPRREPAVPINRSVMPDYIVCLEDGRQLKTLKRHLSTAFNMTPEDYRRRWGLPDDYPMVAPNYALKRSALAKRIGLGRRAAL